MSTIFMKDYHRCSENVRFEDCLRDAAREERTITLDFYGSTTYEIEALREVLRVCMLYSERGIVFIIKNTPPHLIQTVSMLSLLKSNIIVE